MRILIFFIGLLAALWTPWQLPYVLFFLSLGISITGLLILLSYKKINPIFIFCFIAGYCWGIGQCMWRVSHILPTAIENKVITVEGRIASVPNCSLHYCQFLFDVDDKRWHGNALLSWYKNGYQHELPVLMAGQKWRFQVKLKKPRGFSNPGSFDYEAWMFEQDVLAKGYVIIPTGTPRAFEGRRNSDVGHVETLDGCSEKSAGCASGREYALLENSGWHDGINQIRQKIAEKWQPLAETMPLLGVLLALTIGLTNAISAEQWQVFTNTGTIHLISISGFHISFMAGMAYVLVGFIWRRWTFLCMRWPAQRAGAAVALLVGIIYSCLAGMSVPTERSLIMLSVFMGGILWQRQTNVWQCFNLSILAVILWDPFAPLNMSFWLSYGAVGIILYVIMDPELPRSQDEKKLVKIAFSGIVWLKLQLKIFVGLLPFSLFWFYQVSVSSLWANLVAIPVTGFFVLPLALMSIILESIYFPLAKLCMLIAHWFFAQLYDYLAWISNKHAFMIVWPLNTVWMLCFAVLGGLLLLAPKGWPGRYLGIIFCLPLLLSKNTLNPVNSGDVIFDLLDVGQGLASVIRTQHHVLVFDTGPQFSENLDAGKMVILPYLKNQGIRALDAVVVSHGDMDHRGGLASVLAGIPVKRVFVNDMRIINVVHENLKKMERIGGRNLQHAANIQGQRCHADIAWTWDGVTFQFLTRGLDVFSSTNDTSCVLKVSNGKHALLISGDLEKPGEAVLVKEYCQALKADLIVAGHHGSKTSSSPDWIDTTNPRYALFPVGYLNRYHFPSPIVIDRYQKAGVRLFSTVECGMIRWQFSLKSDTTPMCYRREYWHVWNVV